MRINVDPSTDVSGFGYADAGQYRLRIVGCEQLEGPKAPYLKWKIEFADPNVKSTDGEKKVGMIFENTTLKVGDNAQFRLRQLCEALGLVWGDFDTDDAIGLEFDAQLGIREYQDNFSNEVKKYIPLAK